jgi:hypothetical protein
MRAFSVSVLALAVAASAGGQAVTEWRTAGGLPVAVVEIAGGDLEHFAAVVPATATRPAQVGGWPLSAVERDGAARWSLSVPATAATQTALALAPLLAAAGCSALAAAGPAPARELRGAFAALDPLPPAAARPECALADGRVEIVRGSPEHVELNYAVPPPDDPRFDMVPLLAAVVERRLDGAFPGARAAAEQRDGCWRLVVGCTPADEPPRPAAARLRAAMVSLAAGVVTEAEIAAVAAPLRRAAARLAGDAAAAAATIAERLAQGGRAAGTVAPPFASAEALSALLRDVLAARRGHAVVTEAEQRTRLEEPETLAGGVILTTRWLVEEVGVLALAFGGVDPAAGRAVAAVIAARLVGAGWRADTREIAGIAVLTAVLPPEDLPEALEMLGAGLADSVPPTAERDLADDVASALGLIGTPAAETLSVALALPPDADEGVEAARKFLTTLPAGGVRSSAALTDTRLLWTQGEGTPQIAAVVDLPPGAAGWLAGEVLAARVGRDGTMRAAWMSPPGGLAVVVSGDGEANVPALDSRLARLWPRLTAAATVEELDAAGRTLFSSLYGDLPAAMARAALRPFLPGIPSETDLLAADGAAVSTALAGLPAWDALLRVARGPAPVPVAPPVRKSPGSSTRPPKAATTSSS